VALVDVDDSHLGIARQFLAEQFPAVNWSGIKTWFDYRQMFDRMHGQIDAVFVATPDHHHAVATMMAMRLGKHVYVEKPMAHTIGETRQLVEAARKHKVITQMGNQGHSGEGIRRLCEYIEAGAIGNLVETYSWAPTGRGGTGGRLPAKPVPAGLHWDEWIGPAPQRDYHDELHPKEWRSWWDFGEGSIGDWGCHNLDGAFMALGAQSPTSVEVVRQEGGSAERFPLLNVIRWEFPRRSGGSPVQVHWYDGYAGNFDPKLKDEDPEAAIRFQNRPPIVAELEKKYGRELKNGGTIYVGDRGLMYTGNYAGSPRILPEEKHRKFPVPKPKLPRVKGTHQADFLRACKEGYQPSSHFDYSGALSEMVLLGCLAERAGVGKKVEWDAAAMKCANLPELNALVQREYRKGWSL
jgi:predicted dehydrogenase